MQIQKIKTNLKIFFLALVLLGGLNMITAQSIWKNPATSPVNGNVVAPITQGTEAQEKKGQFFSSGIINTTGAIVSYSNLEVGWRFGGYSALTPSYLFGDTYFQMVTTGFGTPAESRICVNSDGKVILCNNTINTGSVVFQALQDKIYTQTNVTEFPTTTGIKGGIKYQIGSGLNCTTVGASNTDWPNGQSLSGTNNSFPVVFYDWGDYVLKMDCTPSGGGLTTTYSVNIHVGGRIVVDRATEYSYKLKLGQDRVAEIFAVSAGGNGVNSDKMSGSSTACNSQFGGGDTYAKLSSGKTIIYLYGGGGGQGGRWSKNGSGGACPGFPGKGGTVATNSLSSSTTHNGYYGWSNDTTNNVGTTGSGCSGIPDDNGNYDKCRSSGWSTSKNYGQGGVGIKYSDPTCTFKQQISGDCHGWTSGGGGGAYAKGNYTLPANDTLLLYAGKGGGNVAPYPGGKNGIITVTW